MLVILAAGGKADTGAYHVTAGGGATGIGFGHFREDAFGPLRTATVSPVPQDGLTAVVTARVWGAQVFLNITGATSNTSCALDAAGVFSLPLWQACFDRYALPLHAAITAYGDTGSIAAIYLLDEPPHPNRWGPAGTITPAMVEAMAAYSKSLFPRIPTAVRAAPSYLRSYGKPFVHLDLTWGQYACRRGMLGPWRDQMTTGAKQLGLGLVLSLNALDGGCTSPAMATEAGYPGLFEGFGGSVENGKQFYAMGPRALSLWGRALVGHGCALLLWQYRSGYSDHPAIRPVADSLARLAREQPARPCRRTG